MKLSEAIRLGAMLRPQAFGTEFDGKGTCAFGAALEACGVPAQQLTSRSLPAEWRWVNSASGTCPECAGVVPVVSSVISMHLNDTHGWTRERIADWVATIEPQDEPPTQPTHEVTHEVLDEPAHSHHDR